MHGSKPMLRLTFRLSSAIHKMGSFHLFFNFVDSLLFARVRGGGGLLAKSVLITPPFGFNLFVLKGLQPDQPISWIMRVALPFIGADLIKIILFVAFPMIALWLPSTMS